MNEMALERRADPISSVSNVEKQVRDIAESSLYHEEWNRVATLARTVPTMPVLLQVCMDRSAVSHDGWQHAPVFQFFEEMAVMAAVELEATRPRYLSVPPALERLAQHPLFLAQRPIGRLGYREVFFFEDDETGEEIYEPWRLEREQVVQYVDGVICPKDKRLAVAVPLAARVGRVVGFLSGLAVSQPHEAAGGMAVLAALVRPLLAALPPETQGNRAARRAGVRKRLPSGRQRR